MSAARGDARRMRLRVASILLSKGVRFERDVVRLLRKVRKRREDETMLKLELDWASESTPDARMDEVGWEPDHDHPTAELRVEYDATPGPAGWPTVRVYAWTNDGAPAYRAGMLLDAWLRDVYGADDESAEELASLADVV